MELRRVFPPVVQWFQQCRLLQHYKWLAAHLRFWLGSGLTPAAPRRCRLKSEHQRRMRMHRHVVNMMTIEDEMMVRYAGAVVEARKRLAYATGIQLPFIWKFFDRGRAETTQSRIEDAKGLANRPGAGCLWVTGAQPSGAGFFDGPAVGGVAGAKAGAVAGPKAGEDAGGLKKKIKRFHAKLAAKASQIAASGSDGDWASQTRR